MSEVSRLLRACRHSWDGILHAFRTEAAVRTEVILLAVALPVAAVLAERPLTFVMLVGVLVMLVAIELLNTAVEKLCDLVQPGFDPTIKIVKDMGSAAVTAGCLVAAATWAVVLFDVLRSH